MIGGYTIATDGRSGSGLAVGTSAGIALKRGSPVQADIWSQGGTHVAGGQLPGVSRRAVDVGVAPEFRAGTWLGPIEGTVELGP